MSTDPVRLPDAAPPRLLPAQRKRLRGWLLAAGLTDSVAAARLATALLLSEGSPGVAGWIQRLHRWLDATAGEGGSQGATALARLAAQADPAAALERGIADFDASGRPAAVHAVPLLPDPLPREMRRQPLGRLPAVLRGGAWILAARWSLPNRIGPRLPRSLWVWRDPRNDALTTPAVKEPIATH